MVSEESFWRKAWGELKLRGAYGSAGRAPGAFDAIRTWNPVGFGTVPAYLPSNVGNPELGPERTAETELGFDYSVFDGRVSAELTHFSRRTSNALFPVRQVPSLGFQSSQLENVGIIDDWGTSSHHMARASAAALRRHARHERRHELQQRRIARRRNAAESWQLGMAASGRANCRDARRISAQPRRAGRSKVELNHIFGPNNPALIIGPNATIDLPGKIQCRRAANSRGTTTCSTDRPMRQQAAASSRGRRAWRTTS